MTYHPEQIKAIEEALGRPLAEIRGTPEYNASVVHKAWQSHHRRKIELLNREVTEDINTLESLLNLLHTIQAANTNIPASEIKLEWFSAYPIDDDDLDQAVTLRLRVYHVRLETDEERDARIVGDLATRRQRLEESQRDLLAAQERNSKTLQRLAEQLQEIDSPCSTV